MKATVPITTLSTDSCQATVDEILITVKPKRLHHPSVHDVSASSNLSASNMYAPDSDDQTAAQDIMTDGIMQIAGGIETVVQQLQLQVITKNLTDLCLNHACLPQDKQMPYIVTTLHHHTLLPESISNCPLLLNLKSGLI